MRKHQFPVEFDKLTSEQLDQVHLWLDEFSYRVTREKLQGEFAIKITQSKLHRYNQKRELADEICAEEEFQLDMKQWYDLVNGNPVPYDEATLKLISKKVFLLLLNPAAKITPSGLAMLHRLATYETSLDITLRRLALAEHKSGLTPKTRGSQPAASTSTRPARAASDKEAAPPPPAPAPKSDLVFPSPLGSIITPPPAAASPVGPNLVTQILHQLPKDLGQKAKIPLAA